jgi:hypothetical protein
MRWEKAGSVDSHRESDSKRNYRFTHSNPASGNNYYRLKMIDQDNTFSYSSVKNVNMDFAKELVKVFPNPVSDVLTIDTNLSKLSKLQLYNTSGITVYDSGKNVTDKINVRNFGEVIYVVKLENVDGTFSVHKILIKK